jgi:hypothetical protein
MELVQLDALEAEMAQGQLALLAQVLRARPTARQSSGPARVRPPFVATTSSSGYGCSASRISSSETNGPYESAVSMNVTPSSTARRSTRIASSWSRGGPQIPGPVSCIAP